MGYALTAMNIFNFGTATEFGRSFIAYIERISDEIHVQFERANELGFSHLFPIYTLSTRLNGVLEYCHNERATVLSKTACHSTEWLERRLAGQCSEESLRQQVLVNMNLLRTYSNDQKIRRRVDDILGMLEKKAPLEAVLIEYDDLISFVSIKT
jgi:hypothetical protein